MELYASGIYPKIFTRIDSLFKAGEGTLGFWRKFDESPTCTMIDKRYALLKPLRGKGRTAPRGVSTSTQIFLEATEIHHKKITV